MSVVPLDEHRDTPGVQSRRGPGDVLALVDGYWALAERISGTEFVPTQLRRRPEAVLAALLSGAERGLGPMESLRLINVIEGRPGLSAEGMRALVLAAGHEIDIVDNTATKATVIGRRAGTEKWTVPFTWTLDRARRARLANKDNWTKYPEAMLLARATSDLCKAIFADVTAGLAVTEEIADELEMAPSTRRSPPPRRQLTARDAAATPTAGGTPAGGSDGSPPSNESATEPPTRPAQTSPIDVGGIPGADKPSWATTGQPEAAQPAALAAAFRDPALTRRIHATINEVFPDADATQRDRYRHALVACVTRRRPDGPVMSTAELDYSEQLELSKRLTDIAAGRATVTDGPDDTIEVRPGGGWLYTVTLDPLTVTGRRGDTAADGLPDPDISDSARRDEALETGNEQPTLDDNEADETTEEP
jgi:hypothetical protein